MRRPKYLVYNGSIATMRHLTKERVDMASIELILGTQKFVLRGEESEEHLHEVAELVKRRVDAIKKRYPSLSFQKLAMLAACDFASQTIKSKRKAVDYRSTVLSKAKNLLDRVELELKSTRS